VAAPIPLLAPVTSAVLMFPLTGRPYPGRGDLLGRRGDLLGSSGLTHRGEAEGLQVVGRDRVLPDDRVQRHLRRVAAPRDLARRLPLARLAVQAPLPGDGGVRALQAAVEADHAEYVGRAGDQMGAEGRPEAPGEPSARAGHVASARVPRERPGERHETRGEALDLHGGGALLRSEYL